MTFTVNIRARRRTITGVSVGTAVSRPSSGIAALWTPAWITCTSAGGSAAVEAWARRAIDAVN